MLPFMQKKSVAGLIIQSRKPDETAEPSDSPDAGLEAAASDLIDAVHAKDAKGVTAALRAAWELMDAPQDSQDESFASQNAKAGQEQS